MNTHKAAPEPGDIWATITNGTARYILITDGGPDQEHPDYQYVRETNHDGTFAGRGRYLQTTTLKRRYQLHRRPVKHYT